MYGGVPPSNIIGERDRQTNRQRGEGGRRGVKERSERERGQFRNIGKAT